MEEELQIASTSACDLAISSDAEISKCSNFGEELLDFDSCENEEGFSNAGSYKRQLFEEIMAAVQSEEINNWSKELYCLLFFRQTRWIAVSSLQRSYKEIATKDVVDEIISKKFFIKLQSTDLTLEEMLSLLQSGSLIKIAKSLKQKPLSTKEQLIRQLVRFSLSQTTLIGNLKDILKKKALAELGDCVKLSDDVQLAFLSAFHLFSPAEMSPNTATYPRNHVLTANLIYTMRLVSLNLQKTPLSKPGIRKEKLFSSDGELMKYVSVCELENEMWNCWNSKKYTVCLHVGSRIRHLLDEELRVLSEKPCSVRLVHYQNFTTVVSLLRASTVLAQAFEKLKMYDKANAEFEYLISINCQFVPSHRRSFWYERAILNYGRHLKLPKKAYELALDVIQDDTFDYYFRQRIYDRVLQMNLVDEDCEKQLATNIQAALDETIEIDVEIPEKVISAPLLSKSMGTSVKTVFVVPQEHQFSCPGVEAVALNYYCQKENFSKGLHSEGSIWLALFGLLCWNEIYDSTVEDVWISRYQTYPLDLYAGEMFWINRQKTFEKKFETLQCLSVQDIQSMLRASWRDHEGINSIVKWDAFESSEMFEEMLSCMDGHMLVKLFGRLASNFKRHSSGFPDLVVAEVKGPGDRLSWKQKAWLSHFIKSGIHAESFLHTFACSGCIFILCIQYLGYSSKALSTTAVNATLSCGRKRAHSEGEDIFDNND
ncbi:VRR-NUC domain protein [Trichinella nativa]|uniref:Fanconi-associated nuclease n=1 Tax=Trichinella nativa TaxID=6335 RepID=A0A1Y3F2X5_9BILA|nr:VRR-NUC domain protein [Trichinella nativa]